MKRCSTCGETKPRSEFNRKSARKDGLQSKCRKCDNEWTKSQYRANPAPSKIKARERSQETRAAISDYKGRTPCADCGQIFPPYVMDFDHRDPENKDKCVSELVKYGNLTRLRNEIAKCDLVCSNCHRIRTHGGVPRGIREPVATRLFAGSTPVAASKW